MGFESGDTNFNSGSMLGISAYHRNPNGTIIRISRDCFGLVAMYCGGRHLFDLPANETDGWETKLDHRH